MKPRFRAAMLATTVALLIVFIGGALPIWTIRTETRSSRTPVWKYHGYPIWTAAFELFAAGDHRPRNVIQAGIVSSVAIMGGILAYHGARPRKRPDAVGDYEEKGNGAIPDGRAEAER